MLLSYAKWLIGFYLVTAAIQVIAVDVPESLVSEIPPPKLDARSWILQDQNSGWVIASHQPDMRVDPASISKLMTAYVVFNEIKRGNLALTDEVHISERAWKTGGSRMFVKVNSNVGVEDLIKGLIVQSGNDAAVALSEHIAGSEEGFAELMNKTAARLGLTNTQYRNSTGLPDADHYSTARDISELSRALIRDFPELYKIYSIRSFKYNKIKQDNRNLLLWRDDSVDGIKTGHTESAGYCLVGSAKRDGLRLISTVMGTASKAYRAQAVHALLKHGFAAYEGFELYDEKTTIANPTVFKGQAASVEAGLAVPLYVVVAKGSAKEMKVSLNLQGPLLAPLNMGSKVGSLRLNFKGELIGEHDLLARTEVAEASFIGRSIDSIKLWFY
ncbi:MAG: D-alanyl-D-alanine carboxypeptidase (penicillin-binding protein 5/6) [Parasphingorhabdus sp.]|jgi:D-alanyl-D-alanine carboxypeptidase (penicillin-binding protein 5/6)